MEEKLDKSFFKKGKVEEADKNTAYWLKKSPEERLRAAYHLSLRAYGYDPKNPPSMDKTIFSKRKRV